MTDIVKDIREAYEAQLQTTLGVTWKPLQNKFDLEKNNFTNSTKRFGVRVLDGLGAAAPLRNYGIDRTFQLIFAHGHIQSINSDTSQQDALNTVESALDDILRVVVSNKLALSTVFNITLASIDAPSFEIENVTILTADTTITYRAPVT